MHNINCTVNLLLSHIHTPNDNVRAWLQSVNGLMCAWETKCYEWEWRVECSCVFVYEQNERNCYNKVDFISSFASPHSNW